MRISMGPIRSSVLVLAMMVGFLLLAPMRPHILCCLRLEKALCAHTAKVNCVYETSWVPSTIYVNDMNGEIATAAEVLLGVWSINGNCLAVVNTSQLPSSTVCFLTGRSQIGM